MEVEEDQLDFHLFAMYRMRLSHYVSLLRFENRLRTFGFYEEAAQLAISIYLDIFDRQQQGGDTREARPSELSASELRKMRNKAKKAEKKKEQESKVKEPVKAKAEKVEAECLTPQTMTYSA